MKRTILALALGMGAIAVTTAPAAAQVRPGSISLRVGGFFPFDEDVRDATGNTWLAAGLEYRFRDLPAGGLAPTDIPSLSISIDYMGRDDVSHVPILINYVGRRESFYYTAGIGLGFISGNDDTETRLAFSVGIGYNFNTAGTNPLFIEGRFWGSSESELNGLAIYGGIRF